MLDCPVNVCDIACDTQVASVEPMLVPWPLLDDSCRITRNENSADVRKFLCLIFVFIWRFLCDIIDQAIISQNKSCTVQNKEAVMIMTASLRAHLHQRGAGPPAGAGSVFRAGQVFTLARVCA